MFSTWSIAACDKTFALSEADSGAIKWDWGFKSQWDWLKTEAKQKYPTLCSVNSTVAQYVIVWSQSDRTHVINIPVPRTETSQHSGTVWGSSGGWATYSGTSTTTRYENQPMNLHSVIVTAWLYEVFEKDGLRFLSSPLGEFTHTGRWRWSKPEKDALEDALKQIARKPAITRRAAPASPRTTIRRPALASADQARGSLSAIENFRNLYGREPLEKERRLMEAGKPVWAAVDMDYQRSFRASQGKVDSPPKVVLRRPESPAKPLVAEGEVFRVGGDVFAPEIVYKIDPEYTSDAREAKCRGTVVLNLIVQQDGTVRDIRVVRDDTRCEKISNARVTTALALGLREKAVEAVKQWRFRPGMKSGQPVDVAAVIEVTFRLL